MPLEAVRYHQGMFRLRLKLRLIDVLVSAAMVLTPLMISAQQCQKAQFRGHVKGGEKFVQAIGTQLEFELEPFKDNEGWMIKLGPPASNEDWAYVVNPPFHSDNSQYMGTAYYDTVRSQLAYAHEVRFTTNATQYEAFEKLMDEAERGADNGDAYSKALRTGALGLLTIKAVDYDKLGPSDQASWMEFEATVTVPKDFGGSEMLKWSTASCPEFKP